MEASIVTPQQLAASARGSTRVPIFVNGKLNVNGLRRQMIVNDVLREDEWQSLDDALVRVVRRDLVGIADLQERGLTRDLGGLGVTETEWEEVDDHRDATQSMSVGDLGDEDTVRYLLNSRPVPITRAGFRLDRRQLEASRNRGASLDTTNAEEATRSVNDKLEDTLVNGGDVVIGGNGIPGYVDFTDNQDVAFNDVEWSSTTDLQNAKDDVLDMKQALVDDGFEGPFGLYIPGNWDTTVEDDYNPQAGNQTLRDRILSIEGIEFVRVLKSLPDSNAILVQLTSDVVSLHTGQDITTVSWDLHGGLVTRFLVMAAMVPVLKSTLNESGTRVAGIAHLS